MGRLLKIGPRASAVPNIESSNELLNVIGASGVDGISSDTAMRLATVNACVRILSESVAMLPCNLMQRTENNGYEKAVNHSAFDVLRNKPNSWMSAFEYWEFSTRSTLLKGNAYSSKTTVGRELRELIPHHPSTCGVKQLDDYSLRYTINKRQNVKQDEVFHLRDASTNGICGISRIQQSSRAFNIATKAEDWAHDVYANSGIMPGYLGTPNNLNDTQKTELRKYWKGMGGRREVSQDELGVPVLTGGLEYKSIDINLEDAQLLEARKMQREDIFGIFRVPPGMGQVYEKATSQGSGVEQTQLQFVVLSLMPLLRRIETSAESSLLTAKERREFKIRFNVNALLRGDMKTRAEFYAKMLMNGAMSINEVRRLEGLNPIDGGGIHRVPLNTESVVSEIMKESEDTEKPNGEVNTK